MGSSVMIGLLVAIALAVFVVGCMEFKWYRKPIVYIGGGVVLGGFILLSVISLSLHPQPDAESGAPAAGGLSGTEQGFQTGGMDSGIAGTNTGRAGGSVQISSLERGGPSATAMSRGDGSGEERSLFYPFTIKVSSYPDSEEAAKIAIRLIQKGDLAFTTPVELPDEGLRHRVYIGFYDTMEKVEAAARNLRERNFPQVDVVRKPYAIEVGVSGSEDELRELGTDLMMNGYVAYYLPYEPDMQKTRVLVGAFESPEAAEMVLERLQEEGFEAQITRR